VIIIKYIKDFLLSVLAGMAISIGCVVFLSVENSVIGSILFSVGLLTILKFGLNLFTGKAPYLCQNKPSFIPFVFNVWAGNFVGTFLASLLIINTRIYNNIIERCTTIANVKLNDSLLSLFILAIFCGVMMYIAVDTYINQSGTKNFTSGLVVVFCVSVFILAGFEHSIADMFYFMLSSPIGEWVVPLIVISFGNIIGGNIMCWLTKWKLKD
jgi:formate/nitrite transporter FocA (FNT family)